MKREDFLFIKEALIDKELSVYRRLLARAFHCSKFAHTIANYFAYYSSYYSKVFLNKG